VPSKLELDIKLREPSKLVMVKHIKQGLSRLVGLFQFIFQLLNIRLFKQIFQLGHIQLMCHSELREYILSRIQLDDSQLPTFILGPKQFWFPRPFRLLLFNREHTQLGILLCVVMVKEQHIKVKEQHIKLKGLRHIGLMVLKQFKPKVKHMRLKVKHMRLKGQ